MNKSIEVLLIIYLEKIILEAEKCFRSENFSGTLAVPFSDVCVSESFVYVACVSPKRTAFNANFASSGLKN